MGARGHRREGGREVEHENRDKNTRQGIKAAARAMVPAATTPEIGYFISSDRFPCPGVEVQACDLRQQGGRTPAELADWVEVWRGCGHQALVRSASDGHTLLKKVGVLVWPSGLTVLCREMAVRGRTGQPDTHTPTSTI